MPASSEYDSRLVKEHRLASFRRFVDGFENLGDHHGLFRFDAEVGAFCDGVVENVRLDVRRSTGTFSVIESDSAGAQVRLFYILLVVLDAI